MTHLNETLYSCGVACSCEGCQTKSAISRLICCLPMCKQNVTRYPYEIVRLAEDIAGGLMVTMPSQKDFASDTVVGRNGETIGDICNKYFSAREGVSTEAPSAPYALFGKYLPGQRRSWLPHRIPARRRLSAGAAYYDCPPERYAGQKRAG